MSLHEHDFFCILENPNIKEKSAFEQLEVTPFPSSGSFRCYSRYFPAGDFPCKPMPASEWRGRAGAWFRWPDSR